MDRHTRSEREAMPPLARTFVKAAFILVPAPAFPLAVGFFVLYFALVVIAADILISDKSATRDEIEEILFFALDAG